MLQETDLLVASVHLPTDRLVGFARVITDFAYLAVILDVIVARTGEVQGWARCSLTPSSGTRG